MAVLAGVGCRLADDVDECRRHPRVCGQLACDLDLYAHEGERGDDGGEGGAGIPGIPAQVIHDRGDELLELCDGGVVDALFLEVPVDDGEALANDVMDAGSHL